MHSFLFNFYFWGLTCDGGGGGDGAVLDYITSSPSMEHVSGISEFHYSQPPYNRTGRIGTCGDLSSAAATVNLLSVTLDRTASFEER